MLRNLCTLSSLADDDFVGLRFEDNTPCVTFPRGFALSEDDKSVRREILTLLTVLKKFSNRKEGDSKQSNGEDKLDFPIQSYQYLIQNYLTHGYYTEREVTYQKSQQGKIDWKRTISHIQPMVDNSSVIYLDFITKRSINTSNFITHIHRYCVYESFSKFGWLYLTSVFMPEKPSIPFNKKIFTAVLRNALKNTFDNDKKQLFHHMISVIDSVDEKSAAKDFQYGVRKFETVWENIIDHVFGESEKDKYFPHAQWHMIDSNKYESSPLKPDTIMLNGDNFFILDAKYYKYGITGNANHLPATSSIQKQITYGEYIAKKQFADRNKIFNAFIMPFERKQEEEPYQFVSIGTAKWLNYNQDTENYKYILGILLDTKYIMDTYMRHNEKEIERMSELIMNSLQWYREKYGHNP